MMRARETDRQGGFTLMELLVTLVVSIIGLAGVLMMQANAVRTNREVAQFGMATSVAEMVMEQVRGQPVDKIAGLAFGAIEDRGTTFTPVVEVKDMAESEFLKSVVVTVSYDGEGNGKVDDPSDDSKRVSLQLVRSTREMM
jgi:type II secretory pathway component PulJ